MRRGPGLWASGVSSYQAPRSRGSCAAELVPHSPHSSCRWKVEPSDLQRDGPLGLPAAEIGPYWLWCPYQVFSARWTHQSSIFASCSERGAPLTFL